MIKAAVITDVHVVSVSHAGPFQNKNTEGNLLVCEDNYSIIVACSSKLVLSLALSSIQSA